MLGTGASPEIFPRHLHFAAGLNLFLKLITLIAYISQFCGYSNQIGLLLPNALNDELAGR